MRVLITGVTGLRNRGVEALVVPTLEQLRERLPELDARVLTASPDYDQRRLDALGATAVSNARWNRARRVPKAALTAAGHVPQTGALGAALFAGALGRPDAVIATGGDVFSSDYGGLHFHLAPLQMALAAGVPVVFLAQSIGPFRGHLDAAAFRAVGRRASLITLRETASLRYVQDELRIRGPRIEKTADPAFLLEPAPGDVVDGVAASMGLAGDRPFVALAPSQGISRYSRLNALEHTRRWVDLTRFVLERLGVDVLLVPHVQETSFGNDDSILATEIWRALRFEPRVHLAPGDLSASELKGLIARSELVVAERMHAGIAGLSSAVPTLLVGYSVKASGIMSDLFGDGARERGLLLPIEAFMSGPPAQEAVEKAWRARAGVREELQRALPQVRVAASLNYDLIADVLREARSRR